MDEAYLRLSNERGLNRGMLLIGEWLQRWCERHGRNFDAAVSGLLDEFTAKDEAAAEQMQAYEATMGREIDGDDTAWLRDAMGE